MAIETIKNGGFVSEEVAKINANFAELNANKANASAIPTKTSDLTNDSNFVTQNQLNDAVGDIAVPTKTSELTNDSNFVNQTQLTDAVNEVAADIPTKISELTNDSGFATTAAMNTALGGKVDKVDGKGLSTEDFTTAEKNKLAGLVAPAQVTVTASSWTASGENKIFTTPANGKKPVVVMRKNGSDYHAVLVDFAISGSNIVITASEAFDGYIVVV